MTPDKTPTDAELDALIATYLKRMYPQDNQPHFERAIMRAVLARWGSPVVAGEPVAWRYRMKGDLQWQYTERPEQFAHADEVQPLNTPQPTQAQAQAGALTAEQEYAIRQGHEVASSDGYFAARPQIDTNDRRKVFQAGFERGWEARGIKQGGQHGIDT